MFFGFFLANHSLRKLTSACKPFRYNLACRSQSRVVHQRGSNLGRAAEQVVVVELGLSLFITRKFKLGTNNFSDLQNSAHFCPTSYNIQSHNGGFSQDHLAVLFILSSFRNSFSKNIHNIRAKKKSRVIAFAFVLICLRSAWKCVLYQTRKVRQQCITTTKQHHPPVAPSFKMVFYYLTYFRTPQKGT